MQPKTRFDVYLEYTLERIAAGDPYDRERWETLIQDFMQLIIRGVDPAKARAIMSLYLD